MQGTSATFRKSLTKIQKLTSELNASPTVKAKYKADTKNDILA